MSSTTPKRDWLSTVAHLEQTRWPWIVIAFLSCALVLVAHNVFQVWLYMKPCEQCVRLCAKSIRRVGIG